MDASHGHQTKTLKKEACPLCQNVSTGTRTPDFICELSQTIITRGPFAHRWPGALQVTSKRHVRDPSQLKYPHFIHTQSELYAIENAIRKVTRPHHMNVVKFGNVVEHLHWHLIPRFGHEKHSQKTPWELADFPTQELFHTPSTQPLDLLYEEISEELKSQLLTLQPPYFATALFVRPCSSADYDSFFAMSLPNQLDQIRRSPETHECFLMQRNYLDFAWDSFGGEIDAGETPIEALHRELKEELGWSIAEQLEVTRQWSNGMVRGFVYLTLPTGQQLLEKHPPRMPCDEVKNAGWYSLKSLLQTNESIFYEPLLRRIAALVAGQTDFKI